MSEDGRRIARDATAYALGNYLIHPVLTISNLIVRGLLGPYLTGVVAAVQIMLAYLPLSSLGALQALEREIPRLRGAGETGRAKRIRLATFIVTVGSATLFAAGVVVWALLERDRITRFLFVGVVVFACAGIVSQATYVYIGLLSSDNEFLFLAKNKLLTGLLTATATVLGVWVGGYYGLLSATAVTSLIPLGWLALKYGYVPRPRELRPLRVVMGECLGVMKFGLPLLAFALANVALLTVDNIMVLRFLGTESLGVYTVGLSAGSIVLTLAKSIAGVIYPRMQEAFGRSPEASILGRFVARPMLIVGMILLPLIATIFFGMPLVVELALPKFVSGIPSLRVLCAAMYFYALAPLPANALVSLGRHWWSTTWYLAGAGVAAAASFVAVRLGLGLAGIALATGLGYFVCFLFVTIHANSQWSNRAGMTKDLALLLVPIGLGVAFMLGVDAVPMPAASGFVARVVVAVARLALFVVVYSLVVPPILEHRTRFIQDFAKPALHRVLRGRKKRA